MREQTPKIATQHHKAKKSLGQHFLRSQKALREIKDAGNITTDDVIVEIGPGEGVLTKILLNFAGKVIAIEKDDDLAAQLTETFADQIAEGKLEVLHQDVLDFDFSTLGFYTDLTYKVIANIPYNITGVLIRNILTAAVQPERMVLLIQKEVAERIVARNGKHSLLSLAVQAYGTPKIIASVPPGAFAPPPKVTSAIIAVTNISRNRFLQKAHETVLPPTPYNINLIEKGFFQLIHIGFAHKRKQLRASLADWATTHAPTVTEPRTAIESALAATGLRPDVRSEDISVDNWLSLLQNLAKHGILLSNEH